MRILKKLALGYVFSLCISLSLMWIFRFQLVGALIQTKFGDPKAKYLSQSPEAQLQSLRTKLDADVALLRNYPFFTKPSEGRTDAGPYLNALVSWPKQPGPLALTPKVRNLFAEGQLFPSQPLNWKDLNLDFSWMRQLHKYDFWSFDLYPPMYGGQEKYLTHEAPHPEYAELVDWAKLRLLYGRDNGDLASAFKEVRQLAWLMMTNESLGAAMSAISILRIEAAVWLSLPPDDHARLAWQVMPLAVSDAARRLFYSSAALVDLRLTDASFHLFSGSPVGLCQRTSEAIFGNISYRRILSKDLQASYQRLDKLIRESSVQCRTSFWRRMWTNPEYQGMFRDNEDIFEQGARIAGRKNQFKIPYAARTTIAHLEAHPTLGLKMVYLLISAQPNFLSLYNEN
jgi:hypothetical protein